MALIPVTSLDEIPAPLASGDKFLVIQAGVLYVCDFDDLPSGGGGISDGNKGDITVSGSGTAWAINAAAVTSAMLRNSSALSVIGRSANSSGVPADIAAANDGEVLRRSGTTLGFGTVATAGIADEAITLAKLLHISQYVLLARTTSGSGDVEAVTFATMQGFMLAPRIQSVTSSATVTPTFADDMVKVTAQAAALLLANPSGTHIEGHGIVFRIKDDGTARAISYDTEYRALGVTLPTTTVIGKTIYLAGVWNDTDTKLDIVAVAQEA